MRYLDLILRDSVNNHPDYIKFSSYKFPAGEINIRILDSVFKQDVTIRSIIKCSDDLMETILAADAVKRAGASSVSLSLPYLPYSRQDRVCNPGEALSLKVFADIINSIEFENIFTFDVHNEPAALCAINNLINIDAKEFVKQALHMHGVKNGDEIYIIAPDNGAYKRTFEIATYLTGKGLKPQLITCNKSRNTRTREVINIDCNYESLDSNIPCFIVDDIIDSGGTMADVAELLIEKGAGEINAIGSHGVFSKPIIPTFDKFNKIYTSNSYKRVTTNTRLKIIEMPFILS